MKILMISDFYPPFLGGAERAVADLGAELSARGHTVDVATLGQNGLPSRHNDGPVTVHRLQGAAQQIPFFYASSQQRFHPPIPDPLLTHRLQKLIAHLQPDLVHGHTWMMLSALPLRRTVGFATVATLHDYALLCPKKTLLYHEDRPCLHQLSASCLRCVRPHYGLAKGLVTTAGLAVGRRAYDDVDSLIAISSYVASAHAGAHLGARDRLVTIPNFVRDALVQAPPGPPLPALPADYILFVGALSRHKGLSVLLDAYARLKTAVPLVLIGSTQKDTPAALPPGVRLVPGLPHAEIVRALDHCRFLVSPALWPEPFGLVAIEAMARGKAVLASRAGGILDIVQEGETGLLVPPGDSAELAAAMGALLDDPAHTVRMGRAGAASCAVRFSASAVVPRIEAVYARARARGRAVAERPA